MDGPGSISGRAGFFTSKRPDRGTEAHQPSRPVSPRGKAAGLEAGHSPQSNAEVKNSGSMSPLPYTFSWFVAENHRDSLPFTPSNVVPLIVVNLMKNIG